MQSLTLPQTYEDWAENRRPMEHLMASGTGNVLRQARLEHSGGSTPELL